MAIEVTASQIAHDGNGITRVFHTNFPILDGVDVWEEDLASGALTRLENGTHYTWAALTVNAQVTAVSAPATGKRWHLMRATRPVQPVRLPSEGKLPTERVEKTLDRGAMAAQEMQREQARTLSAPITEPQIAALPRAVDRAGRLLTFDSQGQPAASAVTMEQIAQVIDGAYVGTSIAAGYRWIANGTGQDFDLPDEWAHMTASTSLLLAADTLFIDFDAYTLGGGVLHMLTAPPRGTVIVGRNNLSVAGGHAAEAEASATAAQDAADDAGEARTQAQAAASQAHADRLAVAADRDAVADDRAVVEALVDTINPAGFATAAQGAKADSAVQPGDLGTAAAMDGADFATAAQGAKADSAVQPGDLGTAAALDHGTANGNLVRLGTGGKLPAVDGSQLLNLPSSGMANPMIAAGDLIVGGVSGAATRLAVGGATTFLKGGTTPAYAALALSDLPNQAQNTILGRTSAGLGAPSALSAPMIGVVTAADQVAARAVLGVATSGMVPLAVTAPFGGVGSVDIISSISGTYDDYLIILNDVRVGSGGSMSIRVWSGSNLQTSNYSFCLTSKDSSSATYAGSTSSSQPDLTNTNHGTNPISGTIRLGNMNGTSSVKPHGFDLHGMDGSNNAMRWDGTFIWRGGTAALEGVRLISGGAGFTSGIAKVFGIRKTV